MAYGDPDEEYALMEWEYEHRYDPPATESEAHAEWHANAGVPMGQPPCPWDACHGEPEPPEDTFWVHETFEPVPDQDPDDLPF